MAGSKLSRTVEGVPIPHTKFKAAVDDEFVNSESIPVEFLKECTNLTPFRKIGALKRVAGTSYVYDTANMPSVPSGYECIDMYYFTIDKDAMEITLLVYKHTSTGETKYFINPYWNPPADYSNHIKGKPASSWVYEWLDLTEYYLLPVISIDGSRVNLQTQHESGKFAGWFACFFEATDFNTKQILDPRDFRKYGFVVDSHESKLYLSNPVNGIDRVYYVFLCRFPVAYLYNVSALNQSLGGWTPTTDHFKAEPTDFIYKENTLRIACGKENRPLLIKWIDQKEFFENRMIEGSYVKAFNPITPPESMPNISSLSNGNPPAITFSAGQNETPAQGIARIGLHPLCQLEATIDSGTFEPDAYYEYQAGNYIRPYKVKAIVQGNTIAFEIHDYGLYSSVPSGWESGMILTKLGGGGSGGDAPPPKVKMKWGYSKWAIWDAKVTDGGAYITSTTVQVTIQTQSGSTLVGYGILERGALSPIKYEGFWFDLAQIPQTYDSITFSGFNDYINEDGTNRRFVWLPGIADPVKIGYWNYPPGGEPPQYIKVTCLSGTTKFAITFRGSMQFYIDNGFKTLFMKNGYTIAMEGPNNRELVILSRNPTNQQYFSITVAEFKSILENFGPFKNCKVETHGFQNLNDPFYHLTNDINQGPYGYYLLANEGGFFGGKEAGNSPRTYNSFLGVGVEATGVPTGASVILKRNVGIISALVDGRNEVIVGMGTFCSNSPILINQNRFKLGFRLKISPWFNRRIEFFNIYNKVVDEIAEGQATKPLVSSYPKFPYFIWANPLESTTYTRINEIPHFLTVGIYEPYKPVCGEIDAFVFKGNAGSFCYKATTIERWTYISFTNSEDGIDLERNGKGLSWISNTGRYIDQDITMNFTKAVFVGQTNGRFFIIGCKNTVNQEEIIDTTDRIYYNIYGAGISQYDIFLDNEFVSATIGDKDIVRGIANFGGYLTVVKDTNTYLLDVMSDPNEVKYRVVDTLSGIGTTLKNGVCEVPFGTIIASNLGIWLDSRGKITSLLTPLNGRIGLYREIMETYNVVDSFVNYYHKFGEIIVSIVTESEGFYTLYQFVYSLEFKSWATYSFSLNSNKLIRITVGEERGLWYCISGSNGSCITRIDESSHRFRLPSNSYSTIPWSLETHYLPYGGRLSEILITWLTLTCDYLSANDININVTINKVGLEELSHTQSILQLPKSTQGTKNYIKDLILEIEPTSGFHPTQMASVRLYSSTEVIDFVINTIYLWVQTQKRVPNL